MRHDRLSLVAMVMALLAGCVTTTPPGVPPPDKIPKTSKAEDHQNAARVHTELAQHYLQTGDLQTALLKAQKALQFDPNYAPAHTLVAVIYQNIGDMANAESHYRRAIELSPKQGGPNNNFGAFLCKAGRPAEAAPYFQAALADPFYDTPDRAWTNAGICLSQLNDKAGAETDFRRAIGLNPQNAEAIYRLADILYSTNDVLHAQVYVRQWDALGQPSPTGLKLGHDVELRLGNTAVAADYRRRLIQLFPASEQARSLETYARP